MGAGAGMGAVLNEVIGEMEAFMSSLDPACLSGADAVVVMDRCTHLKRLAATGEARCAARAAAAHQPGSVFSRGEEWYAVPLFPGTTIETGTTVVVADVERGLLVVYPAD